MTRVHMSFMTADLAATTRFYSALFGAGPDKVRDDYARFQPDGVPITLSVMPGAPVAETNHYGVKLQSTDEVRSARERLVDAGLATREEEATTCCYAVQDKIWVNDPDGRAWEVYVVTDDLGATRKSEDSSCCATDDSPSSCC